MTTRKRLQAKAAKRDLAMQALGLRASGATYKQITEALGLPNLMTAWRLVNVELENVIRESAREILALELARLDRMQMAVWPDAVAGDLKSVDTVLRIMDHRAKLLGLYDRAGQQQQDIPQSAVIIAADSSSDDYIAGLRALRGELPLPPANGNGDSS